MRGATEHRLYLGLCFSTLSFVAVLSAADGVCSASGACAGDAVLKNDVPTLIRGGARHLKHMRWAEPGRLLEMVGAKSRVTASVYNLTSPDLHPTGCHAPQVHEERTTIASLPLKSFLRHLASEEQQTKARAYVEDTYIFSADPTYQNLARNKGSAALHRLETDLPEASVVPKFEGFEHLAGLPYTAVALFIGNSSESSMHQDKGEMNFITQLHGCKDVITAPPEADSVIGRHPKRNNDAFLDTSTLSSWGGLPMRDSDGVAQHHEHQQLTLCSGKVPVPGARHHRLCGGDVLFLPNSTWHALYGDPVKADGPPSMTVTFFFAAV